MLLRSELQRFTAYPVVVMARKLSVEVVFASPDVQALVTVSMAAGASVADAVQQSGIPEQFPELHLDGLQTGIWGRPVERSCRIRDGDRVELYRPLQLDPREARRRLAQSGKTMGHARE
jgi:hypothetical protein